MINVSFDSGGEIMRKLFGLSSILLIALVLGACSSGGFKADHAYKVEPFSFTNQLNEEVTLDDLKGEVWLAQFVFSNCTTICGPMMFNMAELQDMLIAEDIEDYKIVSYTVDPKFDTPEVLQEYLGRYGATDESKWEMLTGYTTEEISGIANKSFKTVVIDDPNSDQVTHGSKFYLVNQQGEVVKTYDGAKMPNSDQDVPYDTIVEDMKALIKAGA